MGIAVVFIAIITLILFAFWLMRFRFQRAVKQVMTAFISAGAIGPNNAVTMEDLGLKGRGWSLIRDYKPYVIQGLMSNNSVEQLDDGRFYLTREACDRYTRATGLAPPGGGYC